jgi:hypothetical protein
MNILLTSLREALDAGVDTGKIVIMLDLAIVATEAPEDGSARTQSKTFKDVAGAYKKWTAEKQAASVPVE